VNDVVDYLLRFEDRGKICFFRVNVTYDGIGSIQIYSHTNWDNNQHLCNDIAIKSWHGLSYEKKLPLIREYISDKLK